MKKKTEVEDKEVKPQIYEIGYLLVPTTAEDDISKKVEAFRKTVESIKGRIIAEGKPVLKDLAYEMSIVVSNKKETYGSGYFGWIKFEGDTNQINVVNDDFKKDDEIIRFIIIKTVLEDSYSIIEKIIAVENEQKNRAAVKDKEKDEEKSSDSKKPKKGGENEIFSEEGIDETIDKLIAE